MSLNAILPSFQEYGLSFAIKNALVSGINNTILRVAKCHGYGGYIHVKKLDGWGKKSGRIHSFAKSSIVLGKFEQLI